MSFPLRTRTRGRPGRNAGVVNVAAAPAFNPLTGWTTDPVHGVWASDPLWTPPADGGAVSSWRNGGSVGGDLVQATGSKQPTYRASTAAFNNQPTVQGDGTDDFLAATVALVAQPVWAVVIGNYGDTTLTVKYLFSGTGTIIYTGGTTNYYAYAGVFVNTGDAFDANKHLHVVKFSGASSSYALDGTSIWSGDIGATGWQNLALFANVAGTSGFNPGHIAYAAIFNTDPTAQAEWADFISWAETTYGLTIA